MHRKKKTIIVVIALLIALLVTPACFVDEPRIDSGRSLKKTSESTKTYSGYVTDTWNWGPGTVSCDTQDQFDLTVGPGSSAILRARGACFHSGDALKECKTYESTLPCGLVLYGIYYIESNTVVFNACNNADAKNAEGNVYIETGPNTDSPTLSGSVSCWFDNGPERHTITFGEP